MMKKFFTKSWFKAACVAVLGLMSVNASAQDATFNFSGKESKTSPDGAVTVNMQCFVSSGLPNFCYDSDYFEVTCNDDSKKISKVTLTIGYTWSAGSPIFTDGNSVVGEYDAATNSWTGSESYLKAWHYFNGARSSADFLITEVQVWLESTVDPSLTYGVSLLPVTNGSISATPTTDVHYNDVVTLTATPEAGYSLEAWHVTNCTTSGSVQVTDNTFKMPASDVTVSASFVKYHSITLSSVENGSIYASKDNLIKEGEVITLAATPASGYILDSWNVTNDETSETISVVNDQFTMPDANVTVSATFIVKPVPTDNYSNDFSAQDLFDECTVIDNNGDYNTWTYSSYSERVQINYNQYMAMDDYLVTPAIILTGGVYQVSFEGSTNGYTEKAEMVYGTAPEASSLTNVAIETQSFYNSIKKTVKNTVLISTPGTYYFAIHGVSDADQYTFYVDNIEIKKISTDIAVSAAGYTTYYTSKAYTMPAGLTGYIVTPELKLEAAYEAGDVVPEEEPLVLQGEAGTYTLVGAETPEYALKYSLENLLDGTDAEETTPVSLYSFYNGGSDAANCYFFGLTLNAASDLNSVGFYYMNATGAAFTNGAHKAYLCLPKTMLDGVAAGEFRGWSFEEMENGLQTGITEINADANAAVMYDLQGRKSNGKGLMIQNGKVVLVK